MSDLDTAAQRHFLRMAIGTSLMPPARPLPAGLDLFDRKARAALYRRHGGWARQPGVLGFEVAPRIAGGVPTGDLALRVHVAKKLPLSKVQVPIPASFSLADVGTVQTDVVAAGQKVPLLPEPAVQPGGMVRQVGSSPGRFGTVGFIGARANDEAAYLVSCSHVLALMADDEVPRVESPLLQGGIAVGAVEPGWLPVAQDLGAPVFVDAACARLAPGMPWTGRGLYTGIEPSGVLGAGDLYKGMRVKMFGASSRRLLWGKVETVRVGAALPVRVHVHGAMGTYRLRNAISCKISGVKAGDSGAAVFDELDQIIGLATAVVGSATLVSPIEGVLDALGLEGVAVRG